MKGIEWQKESGNALFIFGFAPLILSITEFEYNLVAGLRLLSFFTYDVISPVTDFYLAPFFTSNTSRNKTNKSLHLRFVCVCVLFYCPSDIFLSRDSYILMKCHSIIIQLWNWWYFLTIRCVYMRAPMCWHELKHFFESTSLISFYWLLHVTIKKAATTTTVTVKNHLPKKEKKQQQKTNGDRTKHHMLKKN